MFTRLLLLLAVVFLPMAITAQNNQSNQLTRPTFKQARAAIDTLKTANKKMVALRNLTGEYMTEIKIDSSLAYTYQSQVIARQLQQPIDIAKALIIEGDVFFYFKQYPEAIKRYRQAEETSQNANETILQDVSKIRMAKGFEYSGDTTSAGNIYRGVIKSYVAAKDTMNTIIPYRQLGILYFNKYLDIVGRRGPTKGNMPADEEAALRGAMNNLRWGIKALENATEGDYSMELITAYNIIGTVCTYLGETPVDLGYQLKAMQLARKSGNQSNGDILRSIAEAYTMRGENDKALAYLDKCIGIEQKEGNKKGEVLTLIAKSRLLLGQKDRKEALDVAIEALAIAENLTGQAAKVFPETLLLLKDIHTRLGNEVEATDFGHRHQEAIEGQNDGRP